MVNISRTWKMVSSDRDLTVQQLSDFLEGLPPGNVVDIKKDSADRPGEISHTTISVNEPLT